LPPPLGNPNWMRVWSPWFRRPDCKKRRRVRGKREGRRSVVLIFDLSQPKVHPNPCVAVVYASSGEQNMRKRKKKRKGKLTAIALAFIKRNCCLAERERREEKGRRGNDGNGAGNINLAWSGRKGIDERLSKFVTPSN